MRAVTFDSIPHLAISAARVALCWISTVFSKGAAAFWRVRLGPGCRFYGVARFHRLPGSRIVVGSNCTFRSAVWSNYAGINHPCILATLAEGALIEIGDGSGFSGTAIGAAQKVIIGRRVIAGANASISDTDWHHPDPDRRAAGEGSLSAPVRIEDDVWLGANVVVLKGVTIGAGSTVGANSVVTKSIPPGVIAGGNPARPLRAIKKPGSVADSPVASKAQ